MSIPKPGDFELFGALSPVVVLMHSANRLTAGAEADRRRSQHLREEAARCISDADNLDFAANAADEASAQIMALVSSHAEAAE